MNRSPRVISSSVERPHRELAAGEEQDHPEDRPGKKHHQGLDRGAEEDRQHDEDRTQDDRRATGTRAEAHLTRHAAGAVAHRHATEGGTHQIHQTGGDRDLPLGHGSIREQPVVLGGRGDDRVAQGQGHLGQREEQRAHHDIVPGQAAERPRGRAKDRLRRDQLTHDLRLLHPGHSHPQRQQHEHRGQTAVVQKHQGHDGANRAEHPPARRHLDDRRA